MGNINLVKLIKICLTDNCMLYPMLKRTSFEVVLLHFKKEYLKCNIQAKEVNQI